MRRLLGGALCVLLILSGCSYTAKPVATGSYNVYSSFEGKLSGKYLLYVDASALDRPLKPSDFNCSAHNYPLEISASFAESVRQTLSNLVGELEVVTAPVDRTQFGGAKGMIVVRGENVDGRLRVVPGFWSNGIESDVSIVASITVDGKAGRVLGTTVEGAGHYQGSLGLFCDGGAESLAAAAEQASKLTLTRIGEAILNSERVRLL